MHDEKMQQRSFVMPLSPSKRILSTTSNYPPMQESPDMKLARNRLGTLLSGIRRGEVTNESTPRDDQMDSLYEQEEIKRGPGRPKKTKREKRVVFELRGKPFGLRDSGYPESIYSLCRKWMYGKDDELDGDKDDEHAPVQSSRFQSLDLMATKDIYALPPPRQDVPLMDPRPQKVLRPEPIAMTRTDNIEEMLNEYRKHWKNVKKSWAEYNRKREQRYSNSIQLLSTVYGIAQQTQT